MIGFFTNCEEISETVNSSPPDLHKQILNPSFRGFPDTSSQKQNMNLKYLETCLVCYILNSRSSLGLSLHTPPLTVYERDPGAFCKVKEGEKVLTALQELNCFPPLGLSRCFVSSPALRVHKPILILSFDDEIFKPTKERNVMTLLCLGPFTP